MRHMWGSSPLARGLLPNEGDDYRDARIIPARAGFTLSRARARTRAWDHPRSRGVYSAERTWYRGPRGSSPLARGLLLEARDPEQVRRIIPARAGFTS